MRGAPNLCAISIDEGEGGCDEIHLRDVSRPARFQKFPLSVTKAANFFWTLDGGSGGWKKAAGWLPAPGWAGPLPLRVGSGPS